MRHIILTGLALSLLSLPAFAQKPAAKPYTFSQQDKDFIHEVGAGNLAEVQLGQLAEKKATDPAVREFVRWMATDHQLANTRLQAITKSQFGPPALTIKDQTLKQKLEVLNGAQFDEEYVNAMVQDHQQDIPKFQKEAEQGQYLELRTYARNLGPALHQHLTEAQELQSLAKNASGSGAGSEGTSGSSTRAPKKTIVAARPSARCSSRLARSTAARAAPSAGTT